MPRPRHLAVIALPLLLLPLLPGELAADPLPDVPRDHPAATAVARLWRAGIVRGGPHGLFEGDRRLTEEEAVCLSARLAAAAVAQTVRTEAAGVDALIRRWDEYAEGHDLGCPYPSAHWAAREWTYLRQVRPVDVDVLDGWPDPLPTRYEAAVAAARILDRLEEAKRSELLRDLDRDMGEIGKTQEMMPLDWMPPTDEHDAEGHDGMMEPMPVMPGVAPGEAPG